MLLSYLSSCTDDCFSRVSQLAIQTAWDITCNIILNRSLWKLDWYCHSSRTCCIVLLLLPRCRVTYMLAAFTVMRRQFCMILIYDHDCKQHRIQLNIQRCIIFHCLTIVSVPYLLSMFVFVIGYTIHFQLGIKSFFLW